VDFRIWDDRDELLLETKAHTEARFEGFPAGERRSPANGLRNAVHNGRRYWHIRN
jgi:hypothetical protein